MHKYLRAVGFSEFNTKKIVDDFIKKNLKEDYLISSFRTIDKRLVGQYMIKVCPNAGMSIIGEEVRNKTVVDFYYPYVKGTDYTIVEECTIERQSDREQYLGVIDDYRLGMSLIFYLINSNTYGSYLKEKDLSKITVDRVFLSALSLEGHIILPIKKAEKVQNKFSSPIGDTQNLDEIKFDMMKEKENLFNQEDEEDEYDGDFEADEIGEDSPLSKLPMGVPFSMFNKNNMSLSVGIAIPNMGELRNGSMAKLRSIKEDLFSIVETSMVPCGIECDKYNVVAEIISVTTRQNEFTKENLVEMRVNALGLFFNILINEKDLIGEPLPGRRFVGSIWLLGEIDFSLKNTKDKIEATKEEKL